MAAWGQYVREQLELNTNDTPKILVTRRNATSCIVTFPGCRPALWTAGALRAAIRAARTNLPEDREYWGKLLAVYREALAMMAKEPHA